MKRRAGWSIRALGFGLAASLVLGGLIWRQSEITSAPGGSTGTAQIERPSAKAVHAIPTLYCEFTNFADRNPRVGFYFSRETITNPTAYGLIFRRERDGTQDDFGQDGRPRPLWALDTAENPAVLRSPDDSIAINLYDFDPQQRGTIWFEAGLRSIQYLNLGGRCRLSSA